MNVVMVMFKENGERKDFAIDAEVTVIGRKEDCDLRIPLAEVSRRHAQLTLKGGKLVLRDLGSANGTFVNNKRINEQTLSGGDHVVVGPVVFTVQVDGKPETIRQVKTKLSRRPSQPASPAADTSDMEAAAIFADEPETDPISALEALAGSRDKEGTGVQDTRPKKN